MRRYYFRLYQDSSRVDDRDGVALASNAQARRYAEDLVRELMRHAEIRTGHWTLEVCRADGSVLFELPFAALDDSLDRFPPAVRSLVAKVRQTRRELAKACFQARMLQLQSAAIRARSAGRPYLAAVNGHQIAGRGARMSGLEPKAMPNAGPNDSLDARRLQLQSNAICAAAKSPQTRGTN